MAKDKDSKTARQEAVAEICKVLGFDVSKTIVFSSVNTDINSVIINTSNQTITITCFENGITRVEQTHYTNFTRVSAEILNGKHKNLTKIDFPSGKPRILSSEMQEELSRPVIKLINDVMPLARPFFVGERIDLSSLKRGL